MDSQFLVLILVRGIVLFKIDRCRSDQDLIFQDPKPKPWNHARARVHRAVGGHSSDKQVSFQATMTMVGRQRHHHIQPTAIQTLCRNRVAVRLPSVAVLRWAPV